MKEDHLLLKHHHHHHHQHGNGTTTIHKLPLPSSFLALPRLLIFLLLLASLSSLLYTLKFLSHPCPDPPLPLATTTHVPIDHPNTTTITTKKVVEAEPAAATTRPFEQTSLKHVAFGIAASAKLWQTRKEYIKLWWRPREMRGAVWLDHAVPTPLSELALLPTLRLSSDTSAFPYTNKQGDRSAIRISRIVSETLRLRLPDVRWYVMGDDDTVFVPENLLRVLRRLDHRHLYYVGSLSESHLQNIYFNYGMAYGGGGFAISAPLAAALSRVQDRCLHRYPALYGSDDRMHACMAELGVPLTRHPGFHQFDVYGSLFGLLSAHPVAPLVSLHHLDVVEPIFPDASSRAAALHRLLAGPATLDPAAVMQQSVCYVGGPARWTVSVSWGYAVQIIRGVLSPREMEMPTRTFLNWYRRADYTAYAFNTRPVARNPCLRPFVYYLSVARWRRDAAGRNVTTTTVTEYGPRTVLGGGGARRGQCRWKAGDPTSIDRVVVYKRPNPAMWDRGPRRNCCRVLKHQAGKSTMEIDVGVCREGEISEM